MLLSISDIPLNQGTPVRSLDFEGGMAICRAAIEKLRSRELAKYIHYLNCRFKRAKHDALLIQLDATLVANFSGMYMECRVPSIANVDWTKGGIQRITATFVEKVQRAVDGFRTTERVAKRTSRRLKKR